MLIAAAVIEIFPLFYWRWAAIKNIATAPVPNNLTTWTWKTVIQTNNIALELLQTAPNDSHNQLAEQQNQPVNQEIVQF